MTNQSEYQPILSSNENEVEVNQTKKRRKIAAIAIGVLATVIIITIVLALTIHGGRLNLSGLNLPTKKNNQNYLQPKRNRTKPSGIRFHIRLFI